MGQTGYTVLHALQGVEDKNMNRRGAQRGTVVRRGDTWAVRYRRVFVDATGQTSYKQTTQRIGPCAELTLRQARAEADQIVARANDSSTAPASLATFSQFVDLRFVPERVSQLTPAGQAHYTYILGKHVLPALGPRRLCDITPAVVQGLLNGLARQYSKQTVTHARNAVSAVLAYARLLGVFSGALPTQDVICAGRPKRQVQVLSAEQFRALLDVVPAEYRTLVEMVGTGGFRVGEALGLCWDAVNLESTPQVRCGRLVPPLSVVVSRTLSRGRMQDRAKTEAGHMRVVPLTTSLALQLVGMAEALGEVTGPVFRTSRGTPMCANNIAFRVLKPAGKKIGCPWLHWHALRHTAATLVELNLDDRARVLGHADTSMTMHYSHGDVERVRAALEGVVQ